MKKFTLIALGLSFVFSAQAADIESSSGWFSGISALPFSVQWDPELAPQGSALSSHFRSQGLDGKDDGGLSRSLVVGGSGTVPLDSRWSLTGSMASIRNQGMANVSTPSSTGLYDALPYTMTGLGMHYDMTQNLHIQGGWDHYLLNYNRINGNANIDLLSLGLRYGF
ncbi:MAG: hypothetical protein G3H99_02250 [Ferrovum sp.]|nr:hypothetical protein [Ferrovum sp.]NDU87415.1 hypothetical protein [Ferrovum sp.]